MVAVNLTVRLRHVWRSQGPGNGRGVWFVYEVAAVTDGELIEIADRGLADDADDLLWVLWEEWEQWGSEP